MLATLALGVVSACGTGTAIDAPNADTAPACGPKPVSLPWLQLPSGTNIECLRFCDDDVRHDYQCVAGAWVCGPGQISINDCPCGGGLGPGQPTRCSACDGGGTDKTCDVAAHQLVCPSGTYDPNTPTRCDAGAKD